MPTTSTPINTCTTSNPNRGGDRVAKSTKRQVPSAVNDTDGPPTKTPFGRHHKKRKAKNKTDQEKERCPASDSLLKIERLGCDKVRVILAEGWDRVLPQKGEDDPGS